MGKKKAPPGGTTVVRSTVLETALRMWTIRRFSACGLWALNHMKVCHLIASLTREPVT